MSGEEYLKNISIILVEPKNAGNIGSTARAIKNMGLSKLKLINPVDYREVEDQKKMGYRSQDIIKNCQECTSLSEALAEMSLVLMATSRKGKWKKDFLTPKQAAEMIARRVKKDRVAVVFGREESGLTIDESQLGNYFIHIPSAVRYPSLNLAQAVMVIVYEIYQYTIGHSLPYGLPKMANKEDFARLIENIWSLMKFLELKEPEKGLFHRSLKRAINRTSWTKADIAVFDRICKQVRWFVDARINLDSEEVK